MIYYKLKKNGKSYHVVRAANGAPEEFNRVDTPDLSVHIVVRHEGEDYTVKVWRFKTNVRQSPWFLNQEGYRKVTRKFDTVQE